MIDPPIDPAVFAALVEMTGGDVAFVDELVDTYFDDAREQIAALLAAVAAADVPAVVRPAHSLKTNSFNVGAMELGALCRDLEERGRTGELEDAAARVAAIVTGFDQVRQALLADRTARATG